MNMIAFILLISVIVGCTSGMDLERVRYLYPRGDDFNRTMAVFYRNYAESKASNYDWTSAEIFAKKALKAAYSEQILPEDLNDWKLKPSKVPELSRARSNLIKILDDKELIDQEYESSTLAIFSFDCWVDQASRSEGGRELVRCREQFYEVWQQLNQKYMDRAKNDVENLMR
jgi:hypothetical protein